MRTTHSLLLFASIDGCSKDIRVYTDSMVQIPWHIHCLRRSIPATNYVSGISNKQGSGCRGEISSPSALDTRPSRSYLLCGITCVNPAMETEGLSNRPS